MSKVTRKVVASLASIFGHKRHKKTPTPFRSAILVFNKIHPVGRFFHEIFSKIGRCQLRPERLPK